MLLLAMLLGQVVLAKNAQPVIAGIADSPINVQGAVVNFYAGREWGYA